MGTIAFFEAEEWEKKYLAKKLSGNKLVFIDWHLDLKNITQATGAEIISVFIYSKIGRNELARLPNLKMIATMSTGFDHIDLEECKKRGVEVCNVPSYGSQTVAEHAMALLLAIAKNIVPSVERTRRGNF